VNTAGSSTCDIPPPCGGVFADGIKGSTNAHNSSGANRRDNSSTTERNHDGPHLMIQVRHALSLDPARIRLVRVVWQQSRCALSWDSWGHVRQLDTVSENAWIPIKYPHAIYDEPSRQWVSDAEVAETTYTAFNNRNRNTRVTARLIVRRVKDKNNPTDALSPLWRYHSCFTDSAADLVAAEKQHRAHPIVEQVIADLKDSAAAHLASVIWPVRRQRRLVHPGRDRVQPHPRSGHPGQPISRPSPHRHHSPTPDHRALPHHPLRPADPAATTRHLALGPSLACLVHRQPRTTASLIAAHTTTPRPETTVDELEPGQQHTHAHAPQARSTGPVTTRRKITQDQNRGSRLRCDSHPVVARTKQQCLVEDWPWEPIETLISLGLAPRNLGRTGHGATTVSRLREGISRALDAGGRRPDLPPQSGCGSGRNALRWLGE
jgi:hypothetical protein